MDKRKNQIDERNLAIKKLLIVFSVLVCIVVVVLHGGLVNSEEIEKQMVQNLEDVARQNAAILETKIQAQYKLLLSLSQELEGITEENIEDKLEEFQIYMEEFHLKRFAICLPGGMAYSTDGEPADLSYREFYQRGMEGKCTITGVLSDALLAEHDLINIMTIPVFDAKGEVSGVFGLTYDTKIFNESLQIESFEGKGYSCIINEQGEIMSAIGSDGLELSHNIIEDGLKQDVRNEQVIEKLQDMIRQKEEGSGTMYLSKPCHYYLVPVDLMDGSVTWYILTIVPSEVLDERTDPIQHNQFISAFMVMVLVAVGAWMIIIYMREQHRQVMSFAYEDPLTGGANYTKFRLEMERKSNADGSLIVMDIANFNNIAVVAGEASSDIMVKETWTIISDMLRREELAAHIRDDMFLLFLTEREKEKILPRMQQVSEKICKKAREFEVYGIQARYGIYRLTNEETLEHAYSKVMLAREYAVVKLGANYAFYSEVNRVKMQYERQLEDDFPQAIEREEFEVWYQPKYSTAEGKIVGSEALVRWRKEDGSMVSPGEFIPLFEHNGMIVKLDEYMFRAVCRQQKKWLEEGKVVYPVSINISRASLYFLDVHKRYQNIMQEYQIEPEYIQLEVTETVMEEKKNIYELLNKFRGMGIKILMDDFGTGYSSLATLSMQCFDTLKLDKTLIDHIGTKEGETMLYHIIRMGQQIGLHITAEGVESETQVKFLQTMNCNDIQGFYFSRPVPQKEYEQMIN